MTGLTAFARTTGGRSGSQTRLEKGGRYLDTPRQGAFLTRCERDDAHRRASLGVQEIGCDTRAGSGAPHDRDDDVPRDGHAILAGAGRSGAAGVSVKLRAGSKAATTQLYLV